MRIVNVWIGLLCLMVLFPQVSDALVASERPGIQYADQVLFLAKKVVEDGRVAWITLAYEDPRSSKTCRNFFDVLVVVSCLPRFRKIAGCWSILSCAAWWSTRGSLEMPT
ncbi:MAG: hypothetical protein R2864_00535 [Syntrophotaleaceae bacterium]